MSWVDHSAERVKAHVLVHRIRATPGGYKLSFENILFLATEFEADYLPGDPQAMADAVRDILAEEAGREIAPIALDPGNEL